MRKQSVSRMNLTASQYRLFRGEEELITHYSATPSLTLTRPDVVRNPKVNGYRKPSSYFARLDPAQRDTRTDWVMGSASFFPSDWVLPPGGTTIMRKFTGSAPIFVDKGVLAYPQGRPDALRTKILNNVRGEILDVGMVLAEMAATARQGSDIMLRIGRSMQALRKKDYRAFEYLWDGRMPRDGAGRVYKGRELDRFNRQTAAMYLEWKYGIMPSVLDLQGVTEALDANEKGSLWDNPPLAVGRAVESWTQSKTVQMRVAEPGGTHAPFSVKVTDRVTHKARLDYRVEGEAMRGLNRYGLGLSTLPTIMYDRTPFSFVFNMVCPIAEIIKAWTALAGCTVVGYCETLYVDRTFGEVTPVKSGRFPDSVLVLPKLSDDKLFDFSRKAFPSPPMPMPYLRNPVKVGNVASVLALFTQLRPKKGVSI